MELNGIELGYWKHPATGEVRYYVNNTAELAGLELHYYGTGNISAAYLNGEKISNGQAHRELREFGKVWLTEDGEIHTKDAGRHTSAVVTAIKKAQGKEVPEEIKQEAPKKMREEAPEMKPEEVAEVSERLAKALRQVTNPLATFKAQMIEGFLKEFRAIRPGILAIGEQKKTAVYLCRYAADVAARPDIFGDEAAAIAAEIR